MADRIRKADYFSMQVSNRVGEAMRLLKGLRDNGVNLLAFTGFPNGRKAQVDLIPENTAALRRAATKMKLSLGKKKTVFLLQGDDRVGALANMLEKLAAARISMTAMDAACAGKGRYGAMFWVKPKDVARAARAIGAR
ncbi:MAG: hypothetical protein A3G26_01910 [Betaproteobacteria bacterium RIFCSPLOWO2_12_FULL_65_110]|nr:MAG: hypothetical protein A3H33_12165 [Betaproteobacteria bacterium RIFCSPLOWO2_02_FULL_65_20]OGA39012.1 MAG: hypothetical protein A3G26_01910 [Betaproteobacteria bacterium RIFCSPLOWO2_12_FULL_65_110]